MQRAMIWIGLLLLMGCSQYEKKSYDTWQSYGGTNENTHYSTLSQIDTSNVHNLQVIWEYHTGDADSVNHSQIQCNPIIIENTFFGTTPQMKLFAIEAQTGQEKWQFNPFDSLQGNKQSFFIMNNCRGVAYWEGEQEEPRIFYTAGYALFAIDANTGNPISSFGKDGSIDLHDGLGRDVSNLFISATSPGRVYKDLIIMGTRVDEGPAAAPGHIRAYDVKTGEIRWIFHTIPQPGEFGHETWDDPNAYEFIGGANPWSGFSLDEERGMVFAATGSASFDFYGGKRTGDNLFANCLLALDAETGERIWHFQYIHHDVWDRDFPCPPALVTVERNGKLVDAVAQTTKTGFIYVFNRETGAPLFPVEEIEVPHQTELVDEKLSPTQPYPALPPPLVRQTFTEKDLNTLIPDSSFEVIKTQLASYKTGHMFNPPSKQGTVILPGYDGGAEWGGPTFDPETGNLYVNTNEMAWVLTMVDLDHSKNQEESVFAAGKRLYKTNCRVCHGSQLEGSGNNPSLQGVTTKYTPSSIDTLIQAGRRMMPGFKHLPQEERTAIAAFVLNLTEKKSIPYSGKVDPQQKRVQLPYSTTGYNKFLTPEGLPAIAPPWGSLTAVNLNSGKIVWKETLGHHPKLKDHPTPTGTENYGGSVATAGGLLFIAATSDGKFRAFNKYNGDLLWEYDLPVPGFATPSVYQYQGVQYIVIACGGGKLGTPSGDSYLAFALPQLD